MNKQVKPLGLRGVRPLMGIIFLSGALGISAVASAQIISIHSFPSTSHKEAQAKLASDIFAGRTAFAKKDYRDALSNWKGALKYPGLNDFERARLNLYVSQAHAALGQYKQAKMALQIANGLGPRCDEPYQNAIIPRAHACNFSNPPRPLGASSPQ